MPLGLQRWRIRKKGKRLDFLPFSLRPPSHPVHPQIGQQAEGEDHKKPSKRTVTKWGTSVELTDGQNIKAELYLAFKLILFTLVSISGPTKIAICTEHRQAPQRRRIRKTGKPSACLSFCLRPPSHPVHQQIGQQAGGEDRKKPSKQTVTK